LHNGAAAVVVVKKGLCESGKRLDGKGERDRESALEGIHSQVSESNTSFFVFFSWLYSYIAKNDILKTKVLKSCFFF